MQNMKIAHHRTSFTKPQAQQQRTTLYQAPRAALFDNLFSPSKANSSKASLKKLLSTIGGGDYGANTTPQQLAEIKEIFEDLESSGPAGTQSNISGTWKLMWTTEKETLFITKNAGVFGTAAGDIFQVIDVAGGTLQNVIEFPPEGAFIVDSSLTWVQGSEDAKTEFQFTSATVKLPNDREIKLPPFGKGWFKSVYCDGKIRLSRDVRGDYLVAMKVGPPRKF